MKKQKTRQMTGEEPEVKQTDVPHGTIEKKDRSLRCLRDCDMPGIGLFKGGEIIDDAQKIERIADNPNFETNEEEKS